MKTTKDPMIKFRSVIRGYNKKVDDLNPQGGTRVQLYLGGDSQTGNAAIQELIETLTTHMENPRGVVLDLHISKKSYNNRQFDSAIAFVKPTQESPMAARTQTRYVPKGETANATTSKARTITAELKGAA